MSLKKQRFDLKQIHRKRINFLFVDVVEDRITPFMGTSHFDKAIGMLNETDEK